MSQIVLFEMPEDAALRPAWLERKLRSGDCGLLLEELVAMRSVAITEFGSSSEAPDQSLDEFLGPLKDGVLRSGLGVLSTEQFEVLMRSPELLADLVIEIELEGGDYWRDLGRAIDETSLVKPAAMPQRSVVEPGPVTGPRFYRLGALAALAAGLLLAIALWPTGRGEMVAWERPGVFDVAAKGPAYLNHLADAADDWFKQDPSDPQQLQVQIRGFRRGCDLLLAAPHPQLSEVDRTWLRERCAVWSEKFDQQLASLEQGDDWSTVRNAADETVMKLIDALRKRASEAA